MCETVKRYRRKNSALWHGCAASVFLFLHVCKYACVRSRGGGAHSWAPGCQYREVCDWTGTVGGVWWTGMLAVSLWLAPQVIFKSIMLQVQPPLPSDLAEQGWEVIGQRLPHDMSAPWANCSPTELCCVQIWNPVFYSAISNITF